MNRFALIDKTTNTVTNIIVYDGITTYDPPSDNFMVDVTEQLVGIRWVYNPDDTSFSPPQKIVDVDI